MKKIIGVMFMCFVSILMNQQIAKADKYSDAKYACEKFINAYEYIRTLTKSEQKNLVNAMCEAEDDARADIGRSVANRVESQVMSNLDQLKRDKESAERMVNDVLNDESYKDKWDELKGLRSRMSEVLDRMERITNGVKGGNNPAFAFMSKMGMEAHKDYASIHSSDGVSEFEVDGFKVDMITYKCECVEVKANNSSSISKGRGQARKYRDILNTNDDAFKKLVNKDSRFEKCKGQFRAVVACYIYCPEVTDDGQIRSSSIGWTECDRD
jgi:hypothetical protein